MGPTWGPKTKKKMTTAFLKSGRHKSGPEKKIAKHFRQNQKRAKIKASDKKAPFLTPPPPQTPNPGSRGLRRPLPLLQPRTSNATTE